MTLPTPIAPHSVPPGARWEFLEAQQSPFKTNTTITIRRTLSAGSRRNFLTGNSVGFSLIAFASYSDVYSHRHLFVGIDPWWNPAHLLLYAGFVVLVFAALKQKPRDSLIKLSLAGIVISITAAIFNEFWHRVLLFGNPLPEPFPIEPPHALLAVGLIIAGIAALLYPYHNRLLLSDLKGKLALTFTAGSLWLVTAGSAFIVGGAYSTNFAYLFAIGAASFTASLFVAYPTALTGRFGYTTISYAWFLIPNYLFFVSFADGLPLGIALVLIIDLMLAKRKVSNTRTRILVLPLVAVLYGLIYYPILSIELTLALNPLLLTSVLGVGTEFLVEKAYAKTKFGLSGFEQGKHP